MLRSAWFIARKDVGYMLRQKETILWVFLMPILFFYFIGTVTGGFGPSGSEDEPDRIALVAPLEDDLLVDQLVHRLERENFVVERQLSRADQEAHSRRLTIPEPADGTSSFTESVLAGNQAILSFRRLGQGLGTDYDQVRVGRAVYGVLADLVVLAETGEPPVEESFRRLAEMPRALTLEVRSAGQRKHIPTGFEQTIPGTMTMFCMLVLLTSGAIQLVIERQQGLLRRLAATPIPRSAIVLGKWTGKMALALVQIAFAMLAGTILFDMNWGSALPMVCVVLVGWAAFNASLAIVLGNLARSEGQMVGIGVLSSMVLAALGGCWWPIEITPDWMQDLALFLPTGWTMDAMHELVSFGRDPLAALPHTLALSASALFLGWLGLRTFRYQ